MNIRIENIDNNNRELIRQSFIENWGSDSMITRGKNHLLNDLSGYIAFDNEKIIGYLTYKTGNNEIEVTSLNSFRKNQGVGTLLLDKIVEFARQNSIGRLLLLTTNDNLNALRFYQKRKWTINAFYKNSVIEARKFKPAIPEKGNDDIPIRHEIELEYEFD